MNAGANVFNISVPSSAQSGRTFARFRFSSTVGLLPTGPASDGEVEDYRIEITARDAWQNRGNPLNVDANTVGAEVAPIDALLVINEINNRVYSDPATGALPIPPPETPDGENVPFLDVDGNGFASPRDALLIINFLNDQATAAAEGEADDVLQAATAQVVTQAPMIGRTELVAAAGTRASAPSALAERSLPADAVLAAPELDSVLDEIANDIFTARAEQDDEPLDNLASAFAEFGLFDVDGNG